MLYLKYGVPQVRKDGYYSVFILEFDDGYRIDRGTDEDTDLLCFDDMNVDAKCIEKVPLMWVGWSKNAGQFYR